MTADVSRIQGTTRLIGIIGDPIAPVKSPATWNPRLMAGGHDAVMIPIHVRSQDFDAAIGGILKMANLDGLVITMPFKERIGAHIADISRRAQQVGAVNAIRRNQDGGWFGDMFDGVGLVEAVRQVGLDIRGLRAGVIGAGGAGAAIAFALAEAQASALSIVDIDRARAAALAERVSSSSHVKATDHAHLAVQDLDLIVNASPIGMRPEDGLPLSLSGLRAQTVVVDIVTRSDTALLKSCAGSGNRTVSGFAMVAAQTDAIRNFIGYAD